ncbi:MAG: laccase domain-containing protein, partial [Spirochaetia bacterium]|nr:laccase domain-containing protein [Spirochaetia bacterium]
YNILSKLKLKKVIVSDACTCCDTRFFSFRRAMASWTHFSRMLAYIKILD